MAEYIGITIGPIFDTLLLAHSPAAMWFASKMFSGLTETICRNLPSNSKVTILSPHFNNTVYKDGIGRYHDRIIIKSDSTVDIENIVLKSEMEMAETVTTALGIEKDTESWEHTVEFLKQYLQIHWTTLPEDKINGSAFLNISKILDSLEQMPSPNISETNDNPFKQIFKGRTFGNEYVKKYVKTKYSNLWLLDEEQKNFRDIVSIAGTKDGFKRSEYFAIVEADGDGIGNYINSIGDENVSGFSKNCFDYAQKAHALITKFGAMTVYAGGDDLLFIAPVYRNEKTVFDLCHDIREIFKNTVANNNDSPSVSFGIAIRYEKFPLYETLNSSINALYEVKESVPGKDAMMIDFMKGSGQGIKLLIPNDEFGSFKSILSSYYAPALNTDDKNKGIHSVIYALEKNKTLFNNVIGDETLSCLMDNIFDNTAHKKFENFLSGIKNNIIDFKNSQLCDLSSALSKADSIKSFIKGLGAADDVFDSIITEIGKYNDEICLSSTTVLKERIDKAVYAATDINSLTDEDIKEISSRFFENILCRRRIMLTDTEHKGDYVKAFESILRLSKFFIEKAGK